jgi:hypothetical protein
LTNEVPASHQDLLERPLYAYLVVGQGTAHQGPTHVVHVLTPGGESSTHARFPFGPPSPPAIGLLADTGGDRRQASRIGHEVQEGARLCRPGLLSVIRVPGTELTRELGVLWRGPGDGSI